MADTPTVDVQQPHVGQLVVMYLIDATSFGGALYAITPEVEGGFDVVWQGVTYTRFPIVATGFEVVGQGTQPNPKIKISSINKLFLSAIQTLGDLTGAKVTRKRTFAQYLDNGASPDPNKHFPDDIFFIHMKTAQNKVFIEWQLSTALNREGILLPRRQVLKDFGFPGVARTRSRR